MPPQAPIADYMTTMLWLDKGGEKVVEVPQSFIHTLGNADEGKGTDGLQIRQLRNYFERTAIEKAKENLVSATSH